MNPKDEDALFGARLKGPATHEIGETLDAFSAPELRERIVLLEREIARLNGAIQNREATRHAAAAFFKPPDG